MPAVPNGFLKMGLAPELLQAVADMGFTQPTPVQEQTIPLAMPTDDEAAGFTDLMVSSQTGSGKTAAFLLPMLHTLLKQRADAEAKSRADFERLTAEALAKGEPAPKRPKRMDPTSSRNFKAATPGALILCPTRELAQQVSHDAIDLVRHCRGLRVASIIGGMPYQLQIAKLQNADLVVATPAHRAAFEAAGPHRRHASAFLQRALRPPSRAAPRAARACRDGARSPAGGVRARAGGTGGSSRRGRGRP